MSGDRELDFISNPYRLTERSINSDIERFAGRCNCRPGLIEAVFSDKGYYFYYKSNSGKSIPVGDRIWYRNRYLGLNFYNAQIEEIIEEIKREEIEAQRVEEEKIRAREERRAEDELRKQKAQKRRFALQKGKEIGKRFTAAGLAVLIAIGAIKIGIDVSKRFFPQDDEIAITTEAPVRVLNTIQSANDILLMEWANSVCSELNQAADATPYEGVKSISADLKEYGFIPVASNYYSYLDQVDLLAAGMPLEVIGESIDSLHKKFRNAAYSFDESLEGSVFAQYSFDDSIYASAILLDDNGNVITCESGTNEAYNASGELITFDDPFSVYVLKPNGYEGEVFVHDGMEFVELDELEKTNTYGK